MDKRVSNIAVDNHKVTVHSDTQRKSSMSAEHLSVLMKSVSDMIARLSTDGRILYVSPSSVSLLGLAPDLLLERNIQDLVHAGDGELVSRIINVNNDAVEASSCEFRMRHASGNIIWVEMRCQRACFDGQHEWVATMRDISARHRHDVMVEELRHRLEEQVNVSGRQLEMTVKLLRKQIDAHKRDKDALEVSERRYTTLVENILTGIYIHDGAKMVYCNDRFANIFGFDRDNVEGMNTDELFAGDRSLESLLSDDGQEELVEGRTRDGKKVWFKVSRARLFCNGQRMVIGNVIDITEQVAINERLKASEQELHTLSSQLMAAQEMERKRIANELHDGLGQRLSAVKFAVENVWRSTDQDIYPEQAQRLTAIIESMRDAIEEVRRVSMDLRPSILDDLGLVATIGWFCREFGALFPEVGIHRNIAATEDNIHDEIKVVVFRIIQEAFHNITKHANADQIELELSYSDNTLYLQIRDNGRGISTIDHSPCAKGLGLKSMRERAELTNGEFKIDSVAGKGTTITVMWPATLPRPQTKIH